MVSKLHLNENSNSQYAQRALYAISHTQEKENYKNHPPKRRKKNWKGGELNRSYDLGAKLNSNDFRWLSF